MANHLPKRGAIAETTQWGEVKLPPKAERIYGKPAKSDHSAWYLDRDGKIQSVAYRMPEPKAPKGKAAKADDSASNDEPVVTTKPRPDVTQNGRSMIGDFQTDALHEALARAPIEDDMLMALLVLAFTGLNVSVESGSGATSYGSKRLARHAVQLVGEDGTLAFDPDTLRVAARSMLIDVFSARVNQTNSGIVAQIAGETIGAATFLPNMGTEAFLSCLSRGALEGSCKDTPVQPRVRVRDTRAALVEHFGEAPFVHPSALFVPDAEALADWMTRNRAADDSAEIDGVDAADDASIATDDFDDEHDGTAASDEAEAFREAAE